jgi:hypothetical protein
VVYPRLRGVDGDSPQADNEETLHKNSSFVHNYVRKYLADGAEFWGKTLYKIMDKRNYSTKLKADFSVSASNKCLIFREKQE